MAVTKQTTAQRIFNSRYICQVQHMHTLSKNDINIFGVSSSGDRGIDDALLKSWVSVQITIADMVEMHSKGIPIIVTDPRNTVPIYEVLKQHLADWHRHVQSSINVGVVPVEDLRKMDDFASKIFPIASRYKKPEELKISQGFQEIINRGPKAFKINKGFIDTNTNQNKPKVTEKHTPLANLIAKEFGNKTQR